MQAKKAQAEQASAQQTPSAPSPGGQRDVDGKLEVQQASQIPTKLAPPPVAPPVSPFCILQRIGHMILTRCPQAG